jgi:DNA-binding NarL/FixJ family response regulator
VSLITVMIADRERRRAATCADLLRRARGIRVVGTVATVREAVAGAAHQPDILLLDLNMTSESELAAVPLIRARSPRTHIILLTGRAGEAQILDAISYGARGYLGAVVLRRFLTKAVRAVRSGETWVSRAMVAKLIDRLADLSAGALQPRAV